MSEAAGGLTADELLTIAGAVGAAAVVIWGLIRFLIDRMDRGDGAASAKTSETAATLHRRIDEIREQFVRRDDHYREMEQLRVDIGGLREDFRTHSSGVTARLDMLVDRLPRDPGRA